jgi:hypothetical protein
MIDHRLNAVVDRLASNRRNGDLASAVAAWAKEMDVDQIGSRLVGEDVVIEVASKLFANPRTHDRWFSAEGLSTLKKRFSGALNETEFEEALRRMDTRDVVLVALAVAGIAYIAYRVTRTSERSQAPPVAPQGEGRRVLVLVVNATRSDLLEALRRAGSVSGTQGDVLYKATQAIWIGTENEFNSSRLRPWFDVSRRVATESEYDVYLLRFSLPDDDAGFARGASQIDRIDAFARLALSNSALETSERVPSDAYGTTEVYSR